MSGDAGAVRAGGNAFLAFGGELGPIIANLDSQVANVVGPAWRNQGADSFGGAWAQSDADFGQLQSMADDFGNQLVQIAGKIDDLNTLHDVLTGLEIAAGVGIGLSLFTFGISDVEAAAAATEAITVGGEIAVAETALETAVTGALEAIISSASRILLTFAKRFAFGAVAWGTGTAGFQLATTGSVDWGQVLDNAIAGGLAEGLIPASGPISTTLAKRLLAQGWLQGTLSSSLSEAAKHGANPMTWDWKAIDLNALQTALLNVGSGVGGRIAVKVVHATVVPHLPDGIAAKIPTPSEGYVGQHRVPGSGRAPTPRSYVGAHRAVPQ